RPGAVLGRLEDERARAPLRQLAVQAHGGDVVGEETAHDRHDPPGRGGGAELGQARPRLAPLGRLRAHACSCGASATTAPRSPPASKHVRVPVWHAAPTWWTRTRTASPSQSSATERTCWVWPDVSPLRQYSCRERDQNVTRPLVRVRA